MTTKTKKKEQHFYSADRERKNDGSADINASSRRYGAALESGQRGEKESEEDQWMQGTMSERDAENHRRRMKVRELEI